MKKSLTLAAIHLLIVFSLGGKLLYDRATRPRVWIRTASYDPNLPIRGRYVALNTRVRAPWINKATEYQTGWVALSSENHELVASPSKSDTGVLVVRWANSNLPAGYAMLSEPLLFFLPEHAKDPSWLHPGEELWAEVTLPKKGPPRPIQLAVKSKDGTWRPVVSR